MQEHSGVCEARQWAALANMGNHQGAINKAFAVLPSALQHAKLGGDPLLLEQ